jgi:hypothetical protein
MLIIPIERVAIPETRKRPVMARNDEAGKKKEE